MDLMKIYIASPIAIKRIFANAEAVNRHINRRCGKYKQFSQEIQLSLVHGFLEQEQVDKLNKVIEYVNEKIPYYQEKNLKILKNLNDIKGLPIISKYEMSGNIEKFINVDKRNQLVKGKTSGSTGTPFIYYLDKQAMQFNYAIYDHMYGQFSEGYHAKKVRISGAKIAAAEAKPPFWYYIDFFRQLQCSTFHINKETMPQYLKAFKKYKVKWGSGYASAWLFLSELMRQGNIQYKGLSAIFLDSEGVGTAQRQLIQEQFCCEVYQTYGLSEVAMVAVQCKYGHYHIFSESCIVEILDDDGNDAPKDGLGEIVVTNLNAFHAPMIRYRTGDLGILGSELCECGWKTPYIASLEGRVEDYIYSQNGNKIRRLDHVAKEAMGIIGMQIVQNINRDVEISVIPRCDFQPESMQKVVNRLQYYLGADIHIEWKNVDELQKTDRGKVKFIIRR